MALSSLGKLFQRPPEYHIVSDDGTNEKLLSKCSSQYPKEINRIFQALIPGVIAVLSLLALMLLIFLSATFYNASISQQLPNLSLMIPSHSQYPHLHEGDLRTKFQSPIKWNSSNYSPCGRTIASAQAAGCIFGPTTWAWCTTPDLAPPPTNRSFEANKFIHRSKRMLRLCPRGRIPLPLRLVMVCR